MKINQLDEKWSKKYKQSIDCDNPKGFSQRAHCQGRKKTNEAEFGSIPDWETVVAIAAAAKMTPMAVKAMWKTAKGFYKLKKFADKVGIKIADKLVGEDMNESSGSKAELYKLYNKALKMMPGSKPHKEIMARIAELRDELGMNENVNEEISKFDSEKPMSSEVLVQGYGTMSIETLMKNVMSEIAKLSELRGDPQSYRNLQHSLYKNGVFRAKLDALVGALDELQEIKRKGGKRSVNIQKEAEEQQPQEETMPIDIQQVLRFVDDMEDKQQFQPEYADKLRRAISSLASSRKTLSPEILLQVMTLLTQGRR